jgi:hypothetical protein
MRPVRLSVLLGATCVGTSKAQQLLRSIADGPAMPETEQAKAALDRLARRQ